MTKAEREHLIEKGNAFEAIGKLLAAGLFPGNHSQILLASQNFIGDQLTEVRKAIDAENARIEAILNPKPEGEIHE